MDLEKQFKRTIARQKWYTFALVAPLLLFILTVFVFPIGLMLFSSVHSDVVSKHLTRTTKALEGWQETDKLPSEEVFAALVFDLIDNRKAKTDGKVATRLNYQKAGFRSMIKKLARRAARLQEPYTESVIKVDKRWGETNTWRIIKRESGDFTASFYVAALDMEYNDQGALAAKAPEESIYIPLMIRTFWLSGLITLLCLILGFPVAYLLATLPQRKANLLMILVLLPFWTSLLVRTTSWIVLLQTHGPLNDLLVFFGIIDDQSRVRMIYNMTGTIIAMTHILLPFMILPIYSVMRNISPSYMRAATSLGASWWYAFRRTYLPLTIPGISAGGILVFILAIGYYITPALVGGSSGVLISNQIAYHLQSSLNWGLAAALSGLLLGLVLALYILYNRVVGIDRLRF